MIGQAFLARHFETLLSDPSSASAIYLCGKGVDVPIGLTSAGRVHDDPAMTLDTPFRVASNTKTFTAATVLRLAEAGKLCLDDAISDHLDRATYQCLQSAGFCCERITIRHLLAHSSGLADHTDDPNYLAAAFEDPSRAWTRMEQVQIGASLAKPIGEPGAVYHYSDTGYVLLREVIERVSGRSLAATVRDELGFERHGLRATWWEGAEVPHVDAEPRRRQFVHGRDVTDLHPSVDAYGGGGLVVSVRDLGGLTAALFEGRVLRQETTLAEMLAPTGAERDDGYRLGVMAICAGGFEVYGHVGYWGTAALYVPALGIALGGFVAERDRRPDLIASMLGFVVALGEATDVACAF
ncbi:D-alanyl-D-alanine carboxypeptidase [Aureimonas jatrophae]|uniref:D-alanyl-D-alanine carboxypeptidase n=2 Tax=Aureimonas jatrophae TaxID=1166073 RepID=A0A1H0EF21_9HYPH|nr:D-alanyl-D-alanine carboxypeptidase [Aureimonas jatrophae]SDN80962.1 D-alanyl-D-alanine carboxypeptidase [Aureimonas jatrophae]